MAKIVDVSSLVSTSAFESLKSSGYTAAVMSCYQATAQVDRHFAATTANAWSAGMSRVDGYATLGSHSPDTVADTLAEYIKDNNVKIETIWLHVEGPRTFWTGSQSDNRDTFTKILKGFRATERSLGIYTSASQWNPIFGEDFTVARDLPLWYADDDGVPSFNGFDRFGGWARPDMKQYSGGQRMFGVEINSNWSPE
ncbi:GH25 family lysozyme [Streptomyces sp. NPDC059985]|uniref:GH25 family lysozyme n=1 Tax=Streptomyces sp. NPDC059985 TaxID=3347025 RepID=UPI0036CFEEAB